MEDKYRMRQQTVMQETAQFYLRWGWASQASDRAAGPRALCRGLHPSTAPSLHFVHTIRTITLPLGQAFCPWSSRAFLQGGTETWLREGLCSLH